MSRLLVGGWWINEDHLTRSQCHRLTAADEVFTEPFALLRAWAFKPGKLESRRERWTKAMATISEIPSGGRLAATINAAHKGHAWATAERIEADVVLYEHAAQRFAFACKRFLREVRRRQTKTAEVPQVLG